jgi:hypothetical protein
MPRKEERHLLAATSSQFTASSNSSLLSLPCPYALLSFEDIDTVIGEWGIFFSVAQHITVDLRHDLHNFINCHLNSDIARFEQFLSEIIRVLLAQNITYGKSLLEID